MHILVVEDEIKIANLLKKGLEDEHYNVDLAHDGDQALEKVSYNAYDLILLDVMIPKMDGVMVCREIRKDNPQIRILMLTAKDGIEDRITGLDAGADDYVTKPFSLGEISARIRALMRRSGVADGVILQVDDLTLNPATKEATRDGIVIDLTAKEYTMLLYFMRNKNIVLSKEQLIEHVWDYNYEGLSNIVETYVKYLRKKLQVKGTVKELIHTKRGLGYIMKG